MEKNVNAENETGKKENDMISYKSSPVNDPQPTTPLLKVKSKKTKNSRKA
jgi:hypothetical protein